jgi:hypothetical protein
LQYKMRTGQINSYLQFIWHTTSDSRWNRTSGQYFYKYDIPTKWIASASDKSFSNAPVVGKRFDETSNNYSHHPYTYVPLSLIKEQHVRLLALTVPNLQAPHATQSVLTVQFYNIVNGW